MRIKKDICPQDDSEANSSNSSTNSFNEPQSNHGQNNLSAFDDENDSSSDVDSTTVSDLSDSDVDDPASDDSDQIDIQLLRDLEKIQISAMVRKNNNTNSEQLIPKGPHKVHKIRKQGKYETLPYQQVSSPRHEPAQNLTPGSSEGISNFADDRMDLVLSESLNDPGFRNHLLNTLQAEMNTDTTAGDRYKTLITPPLSSADRGMSDANVYGSSSNSSSYYQYTPESLQTGSPQGSDASIEEVYGSGSDSAPESSSNRPDVTQHHIDSMYQQGSSSVSSYNSKSPNNSGYSPSNNYYQQYTPESLLSTSPQSSLETEDNKCKEQNDHDVQNAADHKHHPDKFISNVLSGVKYFLSSFVSTPQSSTEVIPYNINADRVHKLKFLAKIIQNKIDLMNSECSERNVLPIGCHPTHQEGSGVCHGTIIQPSQMSGGHMYQFTRH